jgi:hypothetical protein
VVKKEQVIVYPKNHTPLPDREFFLFFLPHKSLPHKKNLAGDVVAKQFILAD